jgi:hypothetical protein
MDNRHGKKTKFNQTLGQHGFRGTHIYIMSITWQVWQNGNIGRVEMKLSKNYKNDKKKILTRSLKKVMFPYESSKN